MKKQCKRVVRRTGAPPLVDMYLKPERSLAERMDVQALRGGWANVDTFHRLADCRDRMLLAAGERDDQSTIGVCLLAGTALLNMRDRYLAKQRIGATGDELAALDLLVDTSESFWKRQSGALMADATAAIELNRQLGAGEIEMRRRK